MCWNKVPVTRATKKMEVVQQAVSAPGAHSVIDCLIQMPVAGGLDLFVAKPTVETNCVPKYRW